MTFILSCVRSRFTKFMPVQYCVTNAALNESIHDHVLREKQREKKNNSQISRSFDLIRSLKFMSWTLSTATSIVRYIDRMRKKKVTTIWNRVICCEWNRKLIRCKIQPILKWYKDAAVKEQQQERREVKE